MKIHVFITYDVAEPVAVPGSVARTVSFDADIQAHRLIQLAQDTAKEVAVGYLRHVADPQGAPQKPELPEPEHKLYDADPNCKHEIQALWSGVKCKHCSGWFCY